ncbi:GGDEF domain-containing protein [Paenibacillus soyae]|uniref:GGDEF domain-containing protein n=1 Tax=Paenibacillus soyae TaxID=2969249 RepID=A0A9X2MN88_9BACL|nr:GGDEF domain-containing protein [Paenibacillus soyae]MCR2803786.1 GGDEF domain-containing protein [Paenibacillus soyae]
MTVMQWLSGPDGQWLSALSVLVILMLMLFMSVKLYASYRSKQTYRLLIAAIALAALRQLTLLAIAASGAKISVFAHLAAGVLHVVSFIIINFVFMKLYTYQSARLRSMPFTVMSFLTLLIAFLQIVVEPGGDAGHAIRAVAFPLLDVYGVVVTLIILIATRTADMNNKYYGSLIVIFIYECSRAADTYVFQGSPSWFKAMTVLLPIVYFVLLFMLLFEWVIDRLMSTYQSSIVDGLTGLYNRRHFQSKAEALLARGKKAAVIFCDIDNFKKLNDTHGHHKADGVLKRVAEIMKEETSGIGAAGRYGGEELLACISIDRVKPEIVAESIRRRVEEETIVTVSVGFSTTKESASVQELVKQADEAMYYSKTHGKNSVTAYKSIPASMRGMG